MAIFTPPPPKGIYEPEFHFILGELGSSSFGDTTTHLTSRHVAEVMDNLKLALHPNTAQDMQYKHSYVSQQSVDAIVSQLPHCGVPFSQGQIEHVHTVLNKYVNIEKHPGLFSI